MAASGVVVPRPLVWHRRLAAAAIAGLLRCSIATWRPRWHDSGVFPAVAGPVVICVWHNRMPAAMATYQFVRDRWPGKGLAAMISASRDGSLVANVAERFGIQPIRGSTSRRGGQALLEAVKWLERDFSVVILTDGPRGPAYTVKQGIIKLAQLSGRPIVPVSNYSAWKIRLPSWDRFQIPLPFAACLACYGEPMWVPRDANDEECEQLRATLEASMRSITRD